MLNHRFPLALFAIAMLSASVHAQTTPRFEVATIKPNKTGGPGIRISRTNPTRWESENAPLQFLLQEAWNLPAYRIIGGPDWLQKDHFDIQAALPAPVSRDEIRLMLRSLLQERFQLQVALEKRDQPVYVLKRARRGTKLQPIVAGSCVDYDPVKPPVLEPGQPQPKFCGGNSFGPDQLGGNAITLPELARLLEQVTHRAVMNETDLSGRFDIDLKWTPDERTPGFLDVAPKPPEPGPSLFTVLEEQLGLTLEASRAPVEVLIIRSAEHPSDN